jgi:hypothetical protein
VINEEKLNSLIEMGIDQNLARKALVATKNGEYDEIFEFIEKNASIVIESNDTQAIVTDSARSKPKKRKPRHIPLELQFLFTQLQLADKQAVSTTGPFSFSYLSFLHPLSP